jgi:hypothetical protein
MGGIIWLASYPKSGNTWLRAFLHNLLQNPANPIPPNELNKFSLGDAQFDWYAQHTSKGPKELDFEDLAQIRPLVHRDYTAVSPDSVFVKTHQFLGESGGHPLITMEVTTAAVYVVRNPLDVVLSFADHFGTTIDEAIHDMALQGCYTQATDNSIPEVINSWSVNVKSWTQPHPQIHVMRYEDMVQSPEKTFGRLTRFLGLKPPKERLRRAIRFSEFKTLKKLEEKHGFRERSRNAQRFFREGKFGQWRTQLTDEQVSRVVSQHGEQMARFGYLTPRLRKYADKVALRSTET